MILLLSGFPANNKLWLDTGPKVANITLLIPGISSQLQMFGWANVFVIYEIKASMP